MSLNHSVLIGDILCWMVIVSRDNDIMINKQSLCRFGRGGKGMECLGERCCIRLGFEGEEKELSGFVPFEHSPSRTPSTEITALFVYPVLD